MQVTRLCPLEEVTATQLNNTTILSNCSVCQRALSKARGAWYCDRCGRFPNLCSLCHRVVKGLYVWCQVCKQHGWITSLVEILVIQPVNK